MSPSYNYLCHDCGHEFEHSQSMNSVPLKKCKKCGGKLVRMITGGSGFLLKGKDWPGRDIRREREKRRNE